MDFLKKNCHKKFCLILDDYTRIMLYDYVIIWLLILYKTSRFWPLVTWRRFWHKQCMDKIPSLITWVVHKTGPILSNSPGAGTLCHSRLYLPSQGLIYLTIKHKKLLRAQSIQSALAGCLNWLPQPPPPQASQKFRKFYPKQLYCMYIWLMVTKYLFPLPKHTMFFNDH
jgi:hypothetical protein